MSFGEAELIRDRERRDAWLLTVDGYPQSHVDLEDPTYLVFDYIQHMSATIDALADPGNRIDAVHVGGGACTLARYIAATRPGSRQVVFEPDAGIAELARSQLAVGTVRKLRTRVTGGREGIARCTEGSADAVLVDAFERSELPAGLVTVESVRDVARVLRPSGAYVLNIADGSGLAFARRVAATACSVFDHVALLAGPGVLRGRHFGNVVVVASPTTLPSAALARRTARAAFPARIVDGPEVARFCVGAGLLSDAAPTPAPTPPPDPLGLGERVR